MDIGVAFNVSIILKKTIANSDRVTVQNLKSHPVTVENYISILSPYLMIWFTIGKLSLNSSLINA